MVTRKNSSSSVSDAINTLSFRIEKTESDFIGHLQKVENKLEQIAEVTKTVALLQQQTNQQSEQLIELRTQVREGASKLDATVTRIHSRIDEASASTRDRIDLTGKEAEMKIKSIDDKASHTDKELRQWLNRGWGAWAAFVILAGVIQTGFYRWIDGIEKTNAKLETQLVTQSSTVDKHTQQIEQLIVLTREQQLSNKKVEQSIVDIDKQLEVIRSYTIKK